MSPDVIAITDLDLGNKSVTNDIERVLRQIEHWHEGSIAAFPNHVPRFSEVWDGVRWDGQRASFFALQETDEALAREKLLKGPAEAS
jgi:hypothetical protein